MMILFVAVYFYVAGLTGEWLATKLEDKYDSGWGCFALSLIWPLLWLGLLVRGARP